MSEPNAVPASSVLTILPIVADDGARADLQLVGPAGSARHLLLWLPAMGVPARAYLPFAHALAARGVAVALHEWRGLGSSDRRAGRRCDWGYRELLTCDLPASLAGARAALPDAACWIGGHSLGGQFASLFAAMRAGFQGIALVASGAPYWRKFARPWTIQAAYVAAPAIASLLGHFPGRRIGFGGNEARGVIADWARSGRSGRYAAAGLDVDLEALLASQHKPVRSLAFRDDWLGPVASLAWLLGKMPGAAQRIRVLAPEDMGGLTADHFTWMKAPEVVAADMAGWMTGDRAGSSP
jgi:predicted alpha/beta hydrolase